MHAYTRRTTILCQYTKEEMCSTPNMVVIYSYVICLVAKQIQILSCCKQSCKLKILQQLVLLLKMVYVGRPGHKTRNSICQICFPLLLDSRLDGSQFSNDQKLQLRALPHKKIMSNLERCPPASLFLRPSNFH